jgi:hypothetical protein
MIYNSKCTIGYKAKENFFDKNRQEDFLGVLMYFIQHCFICRP